MVALCRRPARPPTPPPVMRRALRRRGRPLSPRHPSGSLSHPPACRRAAVGAPACNRIAVGARHSADDARLQSTNRPRRLARRVPTPWRGRESILGPVPFRSLWSYTTAGRTMNTSSSCARSAAVATERRASRWNSAPADGIIATSALRTPCMPIHISTWYGTFGIVFASLRQVWRDDGTFLVSLVGHLYS